MFRLNDSLFDPWIPRTENRYLDLALGRNFPNVSQIPLEEDRALILRNQSVIGSENHTLAATSRCACVNVGSIGVGRPITEFLG